MVVWNGETMSEADRFENVDDIKSKNNLKFSLLTDQQQFSALANFRAA